MTLLDTIRAGLRLARASATRSVATTYWQCVSAIAAGRDPRAKPDALLATMQQLDKTDDDLAADVQLVAQLQQAETAAHHLADALTAATTARGEADDLERQAVQLQAQVRELRERAEQLRLSAQARVDAARAAAGQVQQLRQQLAERGHAEIAAAVAEEQQRLRMQTEVAQLEQRVSTLDAEIERMADLRALEEQQGCVPETIAARNKIITAKQADLRATEQQLAAAREALARR